LTRGTTLVGRPAARRRPRERPPRTAGNGGLPAQSTRAQRFRWAAPGWSSSKQPAPGSHRPRLAAAACASTTVPVIACVACP